MNRIKAFGAFWYDFVIGDRLARRRPHRRGPRAHRDPHPRGRVFNAWWLLPLVAFAALGWSLLRATPRK